jgi:hypothetical protein
VIPDVARGIIHDSAVILNVQLPCFDVADFVWRKLPGFDASFAQHFYFLFPEFCLLFLRRRNPAVWPATRPAKFKASETGSPRQKSARTVLDFPQGGGHYLGPQTSAQKGKSS